MDDKSRCFPKSWCAAFGPARDDMKIVAKSGKAQANGAQPTRKELRAAHERALERVGKMSVRQGFESLVRAGIYTRKGKLTARYGG